MKQYLELPDGNRVFYAKLSWGYELTKSRREEFGFDCHIIAKTEEEAQTLVNDACLAECPRFKDKVWQCMEVLAPILFYY